MSKTETYYFPNTKKIKSIYSVNNRRRRNGLSTHYNQDGQIIKHHPYQDGMKHGTSNYYFDKSIYFNKQDKVKMTREYKYGQKHGDCGGTTDGLP